MNWGKLLSVFSFIPQKIEDSERVCNDYCLETITWFCRDFNLSSEEIAELAIKLKEIDNEPLKVRTKLIQFELGSHLETWDKGKEILKNREKATGKNVGSLAQLVASRIWGGIKAKEQRERLERVMKAIPYCIIERGPVFHDCPIHHKYTGMIIRADDDFWLTHPMRQAWECDCRLRNISERTKQKLEAKK